MLTDGKSRRYEERLPTRVRAVVRCRESLDSEWEEQTHLMDVSRLGARIALNRSTEPGRVLHLTLSMPGHLRSYDFLEREYRVWAVVRSVAEATREDGPEAPRYKIGVAFIGKNPPEHYAADPSKLYDLKPVLRRNGLWDARRRGRV